MVSIFHCGTIRDTFWYFCSWYIQLLRNMARWGTPHNFLLAFIDELWKIRKTRFLKKWKNSLENIFILHMCTKNHNHMRYSSWDTKWHNFLSFGHFSSFQPPPPNNPENENFGDVIILNLRNKRHDHMMYAYLDME